MARSLHHDHGDANNAHRHRRRSVLPQRATSPRVGHVSDGGKPDESIGKPLRAREVEYNLFAPPESKAALALVSLEEAELEWIQSMADNGWPVLARGFFDRYADFGSGLERVVPLRAATVPARTARASKPLRQGI